MKIINFSSCLSCDYNQLILQKNKYGAFELTLYSNTMYPSQNIDHYAEQSQSELKRNKVSSEKNLQCRLHIIHLI